MIIFLIFIIGVLIGAMLNGLADDLPHRNKPSRPHCHHCQTPYAPVQWIALIGLVTGQGRCKQCGTWIHWRKPVVEVVSALALAYVYLQFGLSLRALLLGPMLECLLLITIIDLEHRLILYVTIFPSAAVALLYGLFGREFDLQTALVRTLIGGAVGFGVFYAFYLLGQLYSRWLAYRSGEAQDEVAFGGGDANLGGVVGLAVGWPGILIAIVYAIFAGGAVSLAYILLMFLRRRNMLFTPIPYGPFIVFGAVILLLFAESLRQNLGSVP